MYRLVFPWPPKELSPNVRTHWAVHYRAKKKYRKQCADIAADYRLPPSERYSVDMVFYTKTKRRPDKDNLVAMMKAGIDGIADALGVDDSCFDYGAPEFGGVSRGGAVVIEVKPTCGTQDL